MTIWKKDKTEEGIPYVAAEWPNVRIEIFADKAYIEIGPDRESKDLFKIAGHVRQIARREGTVYKDGVPVPSEAEDIIQP